MTEHTILVTGAGGAAAVTLIRSLRAHARVIAADIDPMAVGLYLVPKDQRTLIARGDSPEFVDNTLHLARKYGCDLVIPTVDVELLDISRRRGDFEAHGIKVLVESVVCLETCLDKGRLMGACAGRVRVPTTATWDGDPDTPAAFGTRFIVKPRAGAGGRGVALLDSDSPAVAELPIDGSFLIQEYLPGDEYSIDVLGRPDRHIVSAVPRRRDKVDSGIAVAGRTVHDPKLIEFGRAVAECIGVTGVVNVQARQAADGDIALLEVNARFPGTMALTVSAGVDMPRLAVGAVFGEQLPDSIDFNEVGVVRHWDEVVVPIEEYLAIGGP